MSTPEEPASKDDLVKHEKREFRVAWWSSGFGGLVAALVVAGTLVGAAMAVIEKSEAAGAKANEPELTALKSRMTFAESRIDWMTAEQRATREDVRSGFAVAYPSVAPRFAPMLPLPVPLQDAGQ